MHIDNKFKIARKKTAPAYGYPEKQELFFVIKRINLWLLQYYFSTVYG